jgi:hypothetical protein
MEFKLLADRAEIEALNKYPSGCVKHLGLVKFMQKLCKRQQSATLLEVTNWLDSFAHDPSINPQDLATTFKKMITEEGIAII